LHSPLKSNDTVKQIVLQCGDTPVSDITDDTLNSDDTSEQAILQNNDAPASYVSNNVLNSDGYQSRVSNSSLTISPICVKSKSSEDKRIDNFLNERRNEQIRNEIRERNRERSYYRVMKLPLLKPKTHIRIARKNLMINYTSNKFRNRNLFLTLLIYLKNPQNKIQTYRKQKSLK